MPEAGKHTPRQEQEPAAPGVTEVGPGVLRMQLPITMPGLGHVNSYALVDDRGAAVVDPGLPGPQSWGALTARLRDAELPLARVHTVVITHSHPDHFGGARRLVAETGAAVVTHAAFRNWWQPHTHGDGGDDTHLLDDLHPDDIPQQGHPSAGFGGATPWGGKPYKPPLKRRLRYRLARGGMAGRFQPPVPTTTLRHNEVLRLAGREWFGIHTPGHTLDHLCLHDPEGGLLLAGDHVLPTITPHISGMNAGKDPLARFFDSLDRVAVLQPVRGVLPAHGHPFRDLPARAEAIKEHHRERLATLERVGAGLGRPASVEELSHHLFRPARWGSMAESETFAHLEHLRLSGRAERHDADGRVLYSLG